MHSFTISPSVKGFSAFAWVRVTKKLALTRESFCKIFIFALINIVLRPQTYLIAAYQSFHYVFVWYIFLTDNARCKIIFFDAEVIIISLFVKNTTLLIDFPFFICSHIWTRLQHRAQHSIRNNTNQIFVLVRSQSHAFYIDWWFSINNDRCHKKRNEWWFFAILSYWKQRITTEKMKSDEILSTNYILGSYGEFAYRNISI